MKKFITYLPLIILFIIGITFSFAQQNQTTSTSDPEVESLKKRISELEIKLQAVENVEKMELAAKLAEAQAKLRDAEFGKLERDLRDSNHKWLTGWILFFLAIIAVAGRALWLQFKSKADQLVEDEVEKSLNGFKEAVAQGDTLKNELKEAVGQVNILQDQIRILEKEHSASMLENLMTFYPSYAPPYSEQIKALREEALLDVFGDEIYHLKVRCKAVEVLADRKCTQLVSPVISFLNSVADSDLYTEPGFETQSLLRTLVSSLTYIHTQETYEGLAKFLDRLLTEDIELKNVLLTWTVYSLAYISRELNKSDSASILKKAIPFLEDTSFEDQALKDLAEYFDRFNEPEGIKDILTNGLTDRMPEVETRCLELLQNHDPDFVNEWRAQKESANTQTEESS